MWCWNAGGFLEESDPTDHARICTYVLSPYLETEYGPVEKKEGTPAFNPGIFSKLHTWAADRWSALQCNWRLCSHLIKSCLPYKEIPVYTEFLRWNYICLHIYNYINKSLIIIIKCNYLYSIYMVNTRLISPICRKDPVVLQVCVRTVLFLFLNKSHTDVPIMCVGQYNMSIDHTF